ncbi:hypothetical protein ACFP81_06340 [Deinococcus lacus]|uniref:DUF4115 domain-containing protein n=1 Tax=Deinococcus lacus TaxID=392561 RepID=A0ABW1YFL6_9DEIO
MRYAWLPVFVAAAVAATYALLTDLPRRSGSGAEVVWVEPAAGQCGQVVPLPDKRKLPQEQNGAWHLTRTSGLTGTACSAGTLTFVAAGAGSYNGVPPRLEVHQGGKALLSTDVPERGQRYSVPVSAGPVDLLLTNGTAPNVTSARQLRVSEIRLP